MTGSNLAQDLSSHLVLRCQSLLHGLGFIGASKRGHLPSMCHGAHICAAMARQSSCQAPTSPAITSSITTSSASTSGYSISHQAEELLRELPVIELCGACRLSGLALIHIFVKCKPARPLAGADLSSCVIIREGPHEG